MYLIECFIILELTTAKIVQGHNWLRIRSIRGLFRRWLILALGHYI